LKGGKIPVEILVRGKDEAANTQIFKDLADVIKKSGKKVGVLAKDSAQGPFANDWKKVYPSEASGVEEVDVSAAFSAFLALKDDAELVCSQPLPEYLRIALIAIFLFL
jgi:nucleosome binding factor SPN SPT16 subunit